MSTIASQSFTIEPASSLDQNELVLISFFDDREEWQ